MEALVGWLLDHADVQVTDLSDADTGSEECSDEEVVEDVEDTAYAVVSAPLMPICPELWIPPHHSMGPSAVLLGTRQSYEVLPGFSVSSLLLALRQTLVPTSNDVG